jgi:peptide/nickel transport system permease protein
MRIVDSSMGWFVVRRLTAAAALVVLVPSLSFVFFTTTYGGGPVLAQLRDYLDATFIERDLGNSRAPGAQPVGELLREGVPIDVAVLTGGLLLGVALGVLGGIAVARRPRSRRSAALNALSALGITAPVAITAFAIVILFGPDSGSLPVSFVSDQGRYEPLTEDPLAWLQALWVPWLVVALPVAGAVLRLTASALADALAGDPVRTALAKGVAERRALRRHALPFAAPQVSAYVGSVTNIAILNTAIVEPLLNLPGAFRYARTSITNVDFPVIQGLMLVTVVYVVVANLLADLVLAWVDPRAR